MGCAKKRGTAGAGMQPFGTPIIITSAAGTGAGVSLGPPPRVVEVREPPAMQAKHLVSRVVIGGPELSCGNGDVLGRATHFSERPQNSVSAVECLGPDAKGLRTGIVDTM